MYVDQSSQCGTFLIQENIHSFGLRGPIIWPNERAEAFRAEVFVCTGAYRGNSESSETVAGRNPATFLPASAVGELGELEQLGKLGKLEQLEQLEQLGKLEQLLIHSCTYRK